MANLKASKADILVNERNHTRNLHFKSRMKTYIKKALLAIKNKTEDRASIVKEVLRIIDKTASKGIIKKETASRKKSRIATALNKA